MALTEEILSMIRNHCNVEIRDIELSEETK